MFKNAALETVAKSELSLFPSDSRYFVYYLIHILLSVPAQSID